MQSLSHVLDFLKSFGTVMTGVTSCIIAYMVYKFNFKKDSFSKLSLKAGKFRSEASMEHYSLGNSALLELPMYLNILNDEHVYFSDLKNKAERFISKYGYPLADTYHMPYDWYIEISNKGYFDTVDIEISYTINIYKLAYIFDGSLDELSSYELILGDTIHKTESISYISSEDSIKIFVCRLYGAFVKADLVINSLKSKKMSHIKVPTKIDTYLSPYLTGLSYIDSSLFLSLAGKYSSEDILMKSIPSEIIATKVIQDNKDEG